MNNILKKRKLFYISYFANIAFVQDIQNVSILSFMGIFLCKNIIKLRKMNKFEKKFY